MPLAQKGRGEGESMRDGVYSCLYTHMVETDREY